MLQFNKINVLVVILLENSHIFNTKTLCNNYHLAHFFLLFSFFHFFIGAVYRPFYDPTTNFPDYPTEDNY
jgi:hypothetical protein